jgi:hypothetical protein
MGLVTPPNQSLGSNRGSSNQPAGPSPYTAGRGSMPTGDRFRLPTPPADQFPAAAVEPGKGSIPISPFQPGSGMPSRIDVSIPDEAGIARPPMK